MKSRGEALRDYIVRRLLLMIPTFLGITFFTFLLVQFVPGGQIDQLRMALAGMPFCTAPLAIYSAWPPTVINKSILSSGILFPTSRCNSADLFPSSNMSPNTAILFPVVLETAKASKATPIEAGLAL